MCSYPWCAVVDNVIAFFKSSWSKAEAIRLISLSGIPIFFASSRHLETANPTSAAILFASFGLRLKYSATRKARATDAVASTATDFSSFDTTKVNDFVQRYTDPPASCEVQKMILDGKQNAGIVWMA